MCVWGMQGCFQRDGERKGKWHQTCLEIPSIWILVDKDVGSFYMAINKEKDGSIKENRSYLRVGVEACQLIKVFFKKFLKQVALKRPI